MKNNTLAKYFGTAALSIMPFMDQAQSQARPNDAAPEAKVWVAENAANQDFAENAFEVSGENKPESMAIVREGHAGQAQSYSVRNNIITIHMATGNDPELRDRCIAIVKKLFQSEKYTDKPSEVAILYSDGLIEQGALFTVYINAHNMFRDNPLTLPDLAKEVQGITDEYYARQPVASIEPAP